MENKKNDELGTFLRRTRKEKNISLRKLEEISGVSFSHLSKLERGEYTPSKTTLEQIADALSLDKDTLFLMAGYVPAHLDKDKIIDAIAPDGKSLTLVAPEGSEDIKKLIKELIEDEDFLQFQKNATDEEWAHLIQMVKIMLRGMRNRT